MINRNFNPILEDNIKHVYLIEPDSDEYSSSIASGDLLDADLNHDLKLFDKKQYEALLKSKNIVEDYNNFIDINIDKIAQSVDNSDYSSMLKSFAETFNNLDEFQYAFQMEKDDVIKYLKNSFFNISENPKEIKRLLKLRLQYVEGTIAILRSMITNNAKILNLSSDEIELLLKGTGDEVKDIKNLKEVFIKNKNKFIKSPHEIDMRSVGGGVILFGNGVEVDSVNSTQFDRLIQDMVNYDLTILAHGASTKEGIVDKYNTECIMNVRYPSSYKLFDIYFPYIYDNGKIPPINSPIFNDIKNEDDNFNLVYHKITKYVKDADIVKRMSQEKDWVFAMNGVTFNGKTYKSVIDLVRQAKKDGFKKIKIYTCNPDHINLPRELRKDVTFTLANNLMESTNIIINPVNIITETEANNEPDLMPLYELEQNLIKVAEENDIDYYNDTLLQEMTYDVLNDNGELLLEDNVLVRAFNAVLQFIKKVIATIINWVKALIRIIKNAFNKIKSLITGRRNGVVDKAITYTYAVLENAKLQTGKAKSQNDIKKDVIKACNTISKELKAKSDLQLKIINQIKKQAEQDKKQAYNESSFKGGKRMNIKLMAEIARANLIDNSNNLRDQIKEEYEETISSLNTVDKSVIQKDISFIPVFKINESSLNEAVLEPVNEALNAEYEGVMSYNVGLIQRKMMPLSWLKRSRASLQKSLDKYEKNLKEFKRMNDEEQEKVCRKINARNAAYSAGMAGLTTAASYGASNGRTTVTYIEIPEKITPYNYPQVLNSMIKKLKFDINKLDKIIKEKEKKKMAKLKEGYLVQLADLKSVVISEQVSLTEAVQKIKDVNYIGDTYPIYCLLPKNFNESMTLESYIKLCNILEDADLIPTAFEPVTETDFIKSTEKQSVITEGLRLSTWSLSKTENTLKKYKDKKKIAEKYLSDFEKMSTTEQENFLRKKRLTAVAIFFFTGLIGTSIYDLYIQSKGDSIGLTRRSYVSWLKRYINAYDQDIKRFEKHIEELKQQDKK